MATSPTPACQASDDYAFAARYTTEELSDPQRRASFFTDFLTWESKFITGPGVNGSGLTNDGVNPDGSERPWSAASKEALHLCVLARCLSTPSPLCAHVMAAEAALAALEKKIGMYESFRHARPQFHGFLPWFESPTLAPTHDWANRWPCLDNGQFAWAVYEVIHATKNAGQDSLSERYRAHFSDMCGHVVRGGYRGLGMVAMTCNIEGDDFRPEGHDPMPWDQEPFSYFLDLFGHWEASGYAPDERDKIWQDPRRVEGVHKCFYMTRAHKPIAVLKGWHYSSHELWKYLQLPLRNIDCTRSLLANCERARTIYAADHLVRGLWASCTGPDSKYWEEGIAEGVSDLRESDTRLLTPYGGFPTILGDEAVGAKWLRNILDVKDMQGPLGSSESVWADGTACCHVLTWDAKVTTVLAVLGGGDHLEQYLRADGLWERFLSITERMYGEKFGGELEGSDLAFGLPTADVPSGGGASLNSCTC